MYSILLQKHIIIYRHEGNVQNGALFFFHQALFNTHFSAYNLQNKSHIYGAQLTASAYKKTKHIKKPRCVQSLFIYTTIWFTVCLSCYFFLTFFKHKSSKNLTFFLLHKYITLQVHLSSRFVLLSNCSMMLSRQARYFKQHPPVAKQIINKQK